MSRFYGSLCIRLSVSWTVGNRRTDKVEIQYIQYRYTVVFNAYMYRVAQKWHSSNNFENRLIFDEVKAYKNCAILGATRYSLQRNQWTTHMNYCLPLHKTLNLFDCSFYFSFSIIITKVTSIHVNFSLHKEALSAIIVEVQ